MPRRATRKTVGVNAQIFIAPAMAITTDATYDLFLANAPLGEIGVYDGVNALHTNAITSTEEVFIVQRTTQGVKKTPVIKWSDITAVKKLYVAPVKQVSSIGWNGTGGTVNNPTIAANQNFGIKVIETTEGNDPFPTWNYEYTSKPNDTILEVFSALAKKINDDNAVEHKQNQRLVSAKVKSDATYSNFAITGTGTLTMVVTNGSDQVRVNASGGTDGAIDAVVGDYISFDAAATPTDAIGDVYKVTGKVSGTDDTTLTLNRVYTGATQTFTEAEGEGTRVKKVATIVVAGIELTSIDFDVNFRLAVNENLADADITYTTAYTKGNGTYENIVLFESEGQQFHGDTAKNTVFAADFGTMDKFAVSSETYDFFHLNFNRSEAGLAPHANEWHRGHVILAVAKSTGGLTASLATLFGV